MKLIFEKVLLLFLLFILGIGAGTGPHLLRNRCLSPSPFRDTLVSLLNCFSAGVFFATFFMHMMPDSQKEFSAVFGDLEYPCAELLISAGFFFVMVVEQVVMTWYEEKQKKEHYNITIENSTAVSSIKNQNEADAHPLSSSTNNLANYKSITESIASETTVYRDRFCESVTTTTTEIQSDPEENSHGEEAAAERNNSEVIKMKEIRRKSAPVDPKGNEKSTDSNYDNHDHFDPQFNIRSLILLFALSTHALFEGLAIGFQSSVSALRSLLVAVVIHKMALAFSFGISMVNNQATLLNVLISMFIFSVMAPIGIAIGTALNSVKSANSTVEMVVGIMQDAVNIQDWFEVAVALSLLDLDEVSGVHLDIGQPLHVLPYSEEEKERT